MELHGKLIDNLKRAVRSAERLRGFPVHKDTLDFWRGLLEHARAEKDLHPDEDALAIADLIGQLQSQVMAREQLYR